MVSEELAAAIDAEHAVLEKDNWEQLSAFGTRLESLLISEGYAAELMCDSVLPPSACHIMLQVEGIPDYIRVWYNGYRDGYSVSGNYSEDFCNWISGIASVELLLVKIPTIISELLGYFQWVQSLEQCTSCYYGTSEETVGVVHCGLGLTGTGSCSDYDRRTPEEDNSDDRGHKGLGEG